ncbi:MAG: PhzF family phenazine biosynthesis protein [Acidobacteriota bacterium]
MRLPIFQVDAFTDKPFAGNPAAVCILSEPADERWMQMVAREMNLSETAFLYRENDGFHLRWFTPEVEVDLCGHATLASAHILWETGLLTVQQQANFYTRSGLLSAVRKNNLIEMDFPSTPEKPIALPLGLDKALGTVPKYVGESRFDYLLELDSEQTVRDLKPDFSLLKRFSIRGFIVTSRATSAPYDFVSRFFAPAFGIDEDPVTGSAHCCLAPFWSMRLDKKELLAYQASHRGGIVHLRLSNERVFLSGQAITVLAGEVLVPPPKNNV